MKAHEICARAAELVGGDREKTHGNKTRNHANIAALWTAYLQQRGLIALHTDGVDASDVCIMMALLKIARTLTGQFNMDDFVDLAGYAGCAGEIAEAEHEESRKGSPTWDN